MGQKSPYHSARIHSTVDNRTEPVTSIESWHCAASYFR